MVKLAERSAIMNQYSNACYIIGVERVQPQLSTTDILNLEYTI